MFDQPSFGSLGLRQVRLFVTWDVMRRREARLQMRAWVLRARTAGARPLVHVSTTSFSGRTRRPSPARYQRDVGRLVRYLRARGVRDFGTWNEANHKTQPTWDSPRAAAAYFRIMHRSVHRRCSTRTCRVVALDVLDQRGVERYVTRFYRALGSRTWKRRARIVGIHNYADVNRGGGQRTRSIMRAVRRQRPGAAFWFTETGGLVGFGSGFRCDPASGASVAAAERRAGRAVRRVFTLARRLRRSGVRRVYLYNWFGNDCAPNERTNIAGRPADARAGFDAGLVRADGSPRPGLAVVRGALRSRVFAP